MSLPIGRYKIGQRPLLSTRGGADRSFVVPLWLLFSEAAEIDDAGNQVGEALEAIGALDGQFAEGRSRTFEKVAGVLADVFDRLD